LYDWSPHGSGTQTAHLYDTADAGATWHEIANVGLAAPRSVNGQRSVGSSCFWVGLAFASATDGWLTQDGLCFEKGNNADGLLVTHDGGVTWSPDPLPYLGAGGWPPVVFDEAHVMLRARLVGGDADLESADGGRTWVKRDLPTVNQIEDFIDPMHGWIASDSNGLYATENGGLTWSLINASLPFRNAVLQFVDARNGFAVSLPSSQMELWKTTDGGHTWSRVG
jgi:photosystem II stability/assembly factor-like uncharacterized protein